MSPLIREAVAAGSAGVIFLLLVAYRQWVGFPWFFYALGTALVLYAVLRFSLPLRLEVNNLSPVVRGDELDEFLSQMEGQLKRIRGLAEQTGRKPVTTPINQIHEVLEASLRFLKQKKEVPRQKYRVMNTFSNGVEIILDRIVPMYTLGARSTQPQLEAFEQVTLPQLLEAAQQIRDGLQDEASVTLEVEMASLLGILANSGIDARQAIPAPRTPNRVGEEA